MGGKRKLRANTRAAGQLASASPGTRPPSHLLAEIEGSPDCDGRILIYTSRGFLGTWDVLPVYQRLRKMGQLDKLYLLIQSLGGYDDGAYKLADVVHEFCSELVVLVPTYAKSAATTWALSGNRILMGPTSELGPTDPMIDIDPRLVTPVSPALAEEKEPGTRTVNVQILRDFLESTGVTKAGSEEIRYDAKALIPWMEKKILNPWLLGQFERTLKASKQYVTNLLKRYMFAGDEEMQGKAEHIAKQLCEGYFAHDYPLGRRELQSLGLKVWDMPDSLLATTTELVGSYDQMMTEQNIRTLIETSSDQYVSHFPPKS
jgi:hypothetical protein